MYFKHVCNVHDKCDESKSVVLGIWKSLLSVIIIIVESSFLFFLAMRHKRVHSILYAVFVNLVNYHNYVGITRRIIEELFMRNVFNLLGLQLSMSVLIFFKYCIIKEVLSQ